MPRILRLINRLNLGGPTFNAAYLTKYLAPEFETLLVAGMIDESEASSEFVLHEMGLHPVYIPEMYREISLIKDTKAYFKLRKIIRDFKPDIVHTHAAKAGALGRMVAHACGVPVIVHTFHGHVFHSYFSPLKTKAYIKIERYLAKKSSKIIAISESQKKDLSEVYQICAPEKIEIIPLGFDLKKFSENMEVKRRKFRSHYLVDDDEIVISIVGRLVPVKNHRLFLQSIKKILSSTNKKIRAFVVGDGEDWNLLHAIAAELNLDTTDFISQQKRATITFTSWIKEVDEVYAGSDIIALTSLNEGTPVSIIEALASQRPVVSTRVGGVSDILSENKNGLIVPSGSETEFTKALLLLIENEQLRNNLARSSATGIAQKFSHRQLAEGMGWLYNQLLQ